MRWIKLLYVGLLLSGCSELWAQQTEKSTFLNGDTMVVRKFEDGKLISETFYSDYQQYRHRDYVYTDTTFGYFQYEVVKRVTRESVLHEFYLDDGSVCTVASFYGRKLNGSCKSYYRSGALEMDYHYKEDQLQGVQYDYYENGQMSCSLNCVKDVAQGPYREWYPNGNLKEYGYLVNGNVQDTCRTFHPNGQLCTVVIYKDGTPWEVVSNFDEEGNARAMGTLKDGSGTILNYDEKGVLEEADVYLDGEYVESYWEWDLPEDGRPD